MLVFALGAGCTGTPIKGQPGDEMIYSGLSESGTDWDGEFTGKFEGFVTNDANVHATQLSNSDVSTK